MFRTFLNSSIKKGVSNSTRLLHSTAVKQKFNFELEQEIRNIINELPPASKLYQNADGTPRDPSEEELKQMAKLGNLIENRRVSLLDGLTLSKEKSDLYLDNQQDLEKILPIDGALEQGNGKIIDKIPYEDAATGEIKWKVVRENAKEGWENLMYFGFVPALFLVLGIVMFKPEYGIQTWAENELKLRAQEEFFKGDEQKALESLSDDNKSVAEKKQRDELIVERILSGEYDKLAGLKLKTPKLPIVEGDA